MADGAMAMTLSPTTAAPPPPPQDVSRYRCLRGKSVSSPRDFDVFQDGKCSSDGDSSSSGSDEYSFTSSLRSRSKSVSTLRSVFLRSQEPPPPMPPLPAKVLNPKPINISAQSSLKILESLKSPIFSSEHPHWRSIAIINKEAANEDGSRQNRDGAAAGPGAQVQDQKDLDQSDHHKAHRKDNQKDWFRLQTPDSADESAADDKPKGADGDCAAVSGIKHHRRRSNEGDATGDTSLFADEVARLEAETDRILAEQKKLELARLQAQLVTPPPKSKRPLLEKLTFFSRSKRSRGANSQPGTPSTVVSTIFSPAFSQSSRDSSIEEPLTHPLPEFKMSFIERGGKGIVPQTDAPVSASNGGERRVVVRCLSSTINLSVTAETSPVDILKTTADMTRHNINPATSVIVECYFVLGLERRLRRYERVRDVMNSWDRDQQNALLILTSDSAKSDQDLDLEAVPRTDEPPQGFSMQLHHSSKPGKWNKRWVTLLDNGQIYAAKSPNAQPSDKDSSVLCHLTDFDIYAPKESEMRRNLKPPKRFCYAIKSQQKTVVFANGENFVHFFSTDDSQQAASFYDKVHAWRSWYLVNRMVDLQKRSRAPQISYDPKANSPVSPKRSSVGSRGSTCARPSAVEEEVVDEPLMNVNAFRMSKIVITPEDRIDKTAAVRSKSVHRSGTLKKNGAANLEVPKTVKEDEPEFATGGLLGSTYDKLKQSDVASVASSSKTGSDGPFTEAPSLLNGGISKSSSDASDQIKRQAEEEEKKQNEATSWFPSAAEHSARIRTKVVHQPSPPHLRRPMTADTAGNAPAARRERHPAPLLSFSNDFPEPPRFREGPAGARQIPGQPLINFASGGATREPRDSAPRQNVSRRGLPASNAGGLATSPPPQHPPPPPGPRVRSKSAVTQRRYNPNEANHPPMPAMPNRRHPHHAEPRGPPRFPAPEPLVNRAK